MKQLTTREWNVLTYIIAHSASHNGAGPSHYEIRNGCGISSMSTVSDAVDALCAFGLIRMCQHKERTIVLQGGTVGVMP